MEWTLMVLSKFLFFHFLGNQTKTEKELRNDFAWVWGWGLWNLWFFFFFLWCFYAEFSRFMNLVSGFMNFICWRFRCWLNYEKIWFWVVILYIWVLRLEKIWEDLLLGLCLCSCWRSICVCVWLTRKGKKMQENMDMCSYV